MVLDLGCGYGAVAAPLTEAGFSYVGVDVDDVAVAHLSATGIDASVVDLEVPSGALSARLRSIVDGRRLRAILALDVLEHLRHPEACLAAVSALAAGHDGCQLVVSIPNVTHVDIVGKLLLGRWDVMSTGLLDQTHLRFFGEREVLELLAGAGWSQVDVDDVTMYVTEQCEPPDAPPLRPGTPTNQLLRFLRHRADGHATTYQFVRRFEHHEVVPAEPSRAAVDEEIAPPIAALFRGDDADLLADLEAQPVHDVVVIPRTAGQGDDEALAAVVATGARYVVVLPPGHRVGKVWSASLREGIERAPGRVLIAGSSAAATPDVWLATTAFELLGAGFEGVMVPGAYALPVSALADAGVGSVSFDPIELATAVARASQWCGYHQLPELTVSVEKPIDVHDLLDDVVARLDDEPLVHAPGGLGPLLAQWRELVALRSKVAELEPQLTEAREELTGFRGIHDAYARARDGENLELHRLLARATTPWGAAGLAGRRVVGAAQRRLGTIRASRGDRL